MSNPTWELLPKVGIDSGTIKISLGMERQDLRSRMSQQFLPPAQSNFPDEDDFVTGDKWTFIRIRYERGLVRDIEFLRGSLKYQGLELHSGALFKEIEEKFGELGLTFSSPAWLSEGQDCPELGINISSHEDGGGDGDGIECVILSSAMSNPTWKLLPKVGIDSGTIKISLGMERQDLRSTMSQQFLPPAQSDFPDVDDFVTEDKWTFIRIRYEKGLVRDIEFLHGSLGYRLIGLLPDALFKDVEERFGEWGLTFSSPAWLGEGQDCPELGINIATHEDVGGDGEEIKWVILSSNFE